jgi:uncharacterized protein YvpB
MGFILPAVPYKSQYDSDADEFRNDCGPACLAMVLNAFGINVSTNAVYRKTGTKANRYVSAAQLARASLSYGVPVDFYFGWSLEKLSQEVGKGKPAIILVHYGAWSQVDPGVSTQNPFQGPHFVVVVGADSDFFYVNDPLWKEERRLQGFRKPWSHRLFKEAWGTCYKDGNRDYAAMITRDSLPTAPYGRGDWEAQPSYQVDTQTLFRIRAWAAFHDLQEPVLNNPATTNAYVDAMGSWGQRTARHIVDVDDDLGTMALYYYDDPMKWRVIVAFNGLTPRDNISDGDILLIPEPLITPVAVDKPSGGTYSHFSRVQIDQLQAVRSTTQHPA